MQIAFHIGANCTDGDRLLKSLLKNADILLQQGISVPGPARYRVPVREAMEKMFDVAPRPGAGDILLRTLLESQDLRRLVLSNDNFACVPARIFDHGLFYPQVEAKARALHRLFPDQEIALFLSIRNPVGFLQETMQRVKLPDLASYLGLLDPEDLRWSDVVRRIKQGAPDTPLTIWCHEDAPLLWHQLIRRISGAAPQTDLRGGTDLLAQILTPDGLAALTALYAANPTATDAERHAMIATVWQDHAIPDAIEDEIDIPDLDADMVAHLTQSYAQDLGVIAAMPGVELLLPFR